VDERIKLHYGSDFGVRIYSRPGIGTAACIVIPCVRREPPAYESRVKQAL
jgi:sensor histidine kinase YesM